MKYIVIDERRNGSGDIFAKEFADKEKAINEAAEQWYYLTTTERAARKVYVLETENPDEAAANHLDGDIIWSADDNYKK